jgi:hypothetical protein
MIWLFMNAFGFPWIQIVFYKLWKNKKTIFKNSWISFLFLWLFWTPVFFTFSRNILHTYMLPITVPIMFLMVYYWEDFKSKKQIFRVALVFPLIVFIAYFAVFSTGKLENYMNTDKYMLENLKVNSENKQVPLFYWKEKNYSGQFYSDGKAQLIKNESQFDSVCKIHKKIFLVILKKREYEISKKYIDQMVLTESNYKTSIFVSK